MVTGVDRGRMMRTEVEEHGKASAAQMQDIRLSRADADQILRRLCIEADGIDRRTKVSDGLCASRAGCVLWISSMEACPTDEDSPGSILRTVLAGWSAHRGCRCPSSNRSTDQTGAVLPADESGIAVQALPRSDHADSWTGQARVVQERPTGSSPMIRRRFRGAVRIDSGASHYETRREPGRGRNLEKGGFP